MRGDGLRDESEDEAAMGSLIVKITRLGSWYGGFAG